MHAAHHGTEEGGVDGAQFRHVGGEFEYDEVGVLADVVGVVDVALRAASMPGTPRDYITQTQLRWKRCAARSLT